MFLSADQVAELQSLTTQNLLGTIVCIATSLTKLGIFQ